MRKKEITKEVFISKMNIYNNNFIDVPIEERYYLLKGGRGFLGVLQKLFSEDLIAISNMLDNQNVGIIKGSSMGLSVGYKINKVFLAGFGMIEMEYDKKFDAGFSRDMNQDMIKNLPECSYQGEVFIKEGENTKSLGFITTVMEAPYQNIEELVKGLKVTIARFEEEINNIKKELTDLEL